MRKLFYLICLVLFAFNGYAAPDIKIGVVASLTSFAGDYGKQVQRGVELAQEQLKAEGNKILVRVEDDASDARKSHDAYQRLVKVDKVDVIISGTWWANSFVKQSERDGVPVLSCETLHEESTIDASTYYILQGYLPEWINVYRDLIKQKNFKKVAILRFSSGFGGTLASSLKSLLSSRDSAVFAGAVEYQDIEMAEAGTLLLKLKQMGIDAVYVDAQPSGIANFLRKRFEQRAFDIAVLSNSIVEDVLLNKLVPAEALEGVYYSRRKQFDDKFKADYRARYGQEPRLAADLGYYATLMAVQAIKKSGPKENIFKQSFRVGSYEFNFDERRVLTESSQELLQVQNSSPVCLNC